MITENQSTPTDQSLLYDEICELFVKTNKEMTNTVSKIADSNIGACLEIMNEMLEKPKQKSLFIKNKEKYKKPRWQR